MLQVHSKHVSSEQHFPSLLVYIWDRVLSNYSTQQPQSLRPQVPHYQFVDKQQTQPTTQYVLQVISPLLLYISHFFNKLHTLSLQADHVPFSIILTDVSFLLLLLPFLSFLYQLLVVFEFSQILLSSLAFPFLY